jgi:hypothetical protein
VHGAETGCGQRQEHGGSLGDGLVGAFATEQSGSNEVSGVASVHGCTRRTSGFSSSTAGLEEHSVGQASSGENPDTIVGGPDDGTSAQANGMAAPTAALPLSCEVLELTGLEPSTNGPDCLPVRFRQIGLSHGKTGWTLSVTVVKHHTSSRGINSGQQRAMEGSRALSRALAANALIPEIFADDAASRS